MVSVFNNRYRKTRICHYEEIPELMEDAILATEDVRFYSHHGMDFKTWRCSTGKL